MAKQLFSNNASTTLAAAITNSATSITVSAGKGALFSSPSGGDWEILTITDGTNTEVVKLTARSTDTLTVTRAQESTTGSAFAAGATIEGRITKATLESFARPSNTDVSNVAFGDSSTVTNIDGVTLGASASNAAQRSVAIGKAASIASQNNIAIGYGAKDSFDRTWTASFSNLRGDTLHDGANHLFYCSWDAASGSSTPSWVTTGPGAVTSDGSTSWYYIGANETIKTNSVSIGFGANSIGADTVSIGGGAVATKEGVSIGGYAVSTYSGVAIGNSANCFGGPNYGGNVAIGNWSWVQAANYCIAIGADAVNLIERTHVIGGASLVSKTNNSGDFAVSFAAQENYIFTNAISLTQTAADNIATINIPTGASFYPNEVGLIVTSASGVTVQPEISFGITGNSTSILAQTATTKSAAKGRDKFTPISGDGIAGAIKMSLKVSATATAMMGRFYIKGVMVED